jgi:hypothetical protein
MRDRMCEAPGCGRSATWIRTRAEQAELSEFLCAGHWRELQARQSAGITAYSPIRGDERGIAGQEDLRPGDDAEMDIAFDVRDSYLYVRISGEWIPQAIQEAVLRIRDEAIRHGRKRLLVDGRGIGIPASDFYRYLAGQDAARFLHPPYRTAVIGMPENVTGFAETVANVGGASFKVFVADARAMEWLLRGSADIGG